MEFEALGADEATIQSIADKVKQILTRDEAITCIVVQQKLVGLKPDAAVLTNRRCIAFRPGLLKVAFDDGLWRDLEDVHLDEGLLSSKLTFRFSGGRQVVVDRLPKDHARRAYALAQEKEQEAIETRRQRQMEEDRARAGGVIVGAGVPPPPGTPPAGGTMAKLTQLKALFDAQLITEEEYNQKKAQILSEM